MRIIGITASKDFLYLAMTTGDKASFAISQHHRIQVDHMDWASLVSTLSTFLNSYDADETIGRVVIVCCASGMYGASPVAFKAEGFAEHQCQERGYPISYATKKSLPKFLGCQSGQKWQARAQQLFNSQKKITYFTSGYDAAISGAYGVTV